MAVQTTKLASLGILLVMCIVSGVVLPFVILRVLSSKFKTASLKNTLGMMNCFSAGVFLSTSLLALLPEARDVATEAFPALSPKYPLTELLLASGFLLILVIECVTTTMLLRHRNLSDNIRLDEIENPANLDFQTKGKLKRYMNVAPIDMSSIENGCGKHHEAEIGKQDVSDTKPPVPSDPIAIETEEMIHVHPSKLTNIRSYVIIVALSIHMLFEGLELGLLTENSQVWSVLGALSIHKILIFFSMGLNLCENNTTKKFIIAMVYLSLVSPLGVGVGIAMTSDPDSPARSGISAVLQGLAVGTFLYVAILEVLAKEFRSQIDSWRIYKSLSAVAGCATFAVLQYAMPE